MTRTDASRDGNFVPTLLGSSSVDGKPVVLWADPTTHRLLVDATGATVNFQTDIFTSTNNQTTFTPSKTPVYTLYMSVNGSIQTPATDYSLTGGSYVLSSGIPSGNAVVILYTF